MLSCLESKLPLFTACLPSVILNDAESDLHCRPDSGDRLRHRRVLSEGEGATTPFLPPEIFQRLQTVETSDKK